MRLAFWELGLMSRMLISAWKVKQLVAYIQDSSMVLYNYCTKNRTKYSTHIMFTRQNDGKLLYKLAIELIYLLEEYDSTFPVFIILSYLIP